MEKKEDELISVEKIEEIDDVISMLRLNFKSNASCYYIGNFLETLEYQNQIVQYVETEGMFKKERERFATDVQDVHKVNVIQAEGILKLYPSEMPKNNCSVAFTDIEAGDPRRVEVLYCSSVSYESSEKADWRELTLMDSQWRIAKCKQFSPEDKSKEMVGKYLRVPIWRTRFGFNVDEFEEASEYENLENPKVLLACRYIEQVLAEDFDLKTVAANTGLIDCIKRFQLNEEYEVGYECVRLAEQLYFTDAMINATNIYDLKLLKRYFVLSRLYMTKMKETSALSEVALNVLLIARTKFSSDGKLLALIDDRSYQNIPERDLIPGINQLVESIAKAELTYYYKERRTL